MDQYYILILIIKKLALFSKKILKCTQIEIVSNVKIHFSISKKRKYREKA